MSENATSAGAGPCPRRHPSASQKAPINRHRPLHLEFRLAERPGLRERHCPARGKGQTNEVSVQAVSAQAASAAS